MSYRLIQGDNRVALKTLPDNSIDAIVTDPPYGIDFLGKDWDANTGALETYQECLRVLKPGGHILAFSAARTYHHLAITLEQAGFEIRDQIMWIYSSGFPKSQDVGRTIQRSLGVKKRGAKRGGAVTGNDVYEGGYKGGKDKGEFEPVITTDPEAKQWEGWGTALKPAHEPICLARKPVRGSIKDTVQRWGTGALNIDATRIPYVDDRDIKSAQFGRPSRGNHSYINTEAQQTRDNLDVVQANEQGRFPSNVIGEIPDYQKYFYCPKVSRRERHLGFDEYNSVKTMMEHMNAYYVDNNDKPFRPQNNDPYMIYIPGKGKVYPHGLKHEYSEWCKKNNSKLGNVGNNHPTVKPIELMKYLIRLITPPGGTVLDPFNGSGSTGMAAVGLGFNYIGCELDPHYIEISRKRIDAWIQPEEPEPTTNFRDLFDEDAT
jgi:DNA modification methylase